MNIFLTRYSYPEITGRKNWNSEDFKAVVIKILKKYWRKDKHDERQISDLEPLKSNQMENLKLKYEIRMKKKITGWD